MLKFSLGDIMANLENMHARAMKLYEEKNLEEALKIYEEIIKTNPIDEVALSCVMDIYLELDDKFNYYLARANVNISQNKIEYAINDTKKALELDQENINARRKLARLYKIANKNLKAIDEFTRLLQLSPKEYDAYFELVEIYTKEQALDSAIVAALDGLKEFEGDEQLSNLLAQLYFKANDLENAFKVAKSEFLKAKILLQGEKNQEAKSILDSFIVDSLDEVGRKNYYILNAQYFYNTKDFKSALLNVQNYTKIATPDALSFQMKALIYEELNDDFNAYLNWGFMKKLQGKTDEAIAEFNNAYHENPNDKTALVELARLYQKIKEKYVAMEFWQKVYDIDQDEEAKDILAEFYYSEGNFEKAQEFGKEAPKKEKGAQEEENYEGLLDKIMNFFAKK